MEDGVVVSVLAEFRGARPARGVGRATLQALPRPLRPPWAAAERFIFEEHAVGATDADRTTARLLQLGLRARRAVERRDGHPAVGARLWLMR